MLTRIHSLVVRPGVRRRALVLGALGLIVWVVFLDSHSLLTRLGYAHERSLLRTEVEQLRVENESLHIQIQEGVTDEVVEEVAREQYGMRRAGETVYPLEHLPD